MADKTGIRGLYNKSIDIGAVKLKFVKDLQFPKSRDTFDDETSESASFKAKGIGSKDASVTGNFKIVTVAGTDNPAADALEASLDAGTSITVTYRNITLAGEPEYTATGVCTQFDSDFGDPQMINFTIAFTSAPTEAAQTA